MCSYFKISMNLYFPLAVYRAGRSVSLFAATVAESGTLISIYQESEEIQRLSSL